MIARYGEEIIHISNFQRSMHWGKIHCPFCDPPLRVNYNVNGYFTAWPDEGGHNCRKIDAQYFDVDWEGKDYVEIIQLEKKNLQVTIDMESLTQISSAIQSGNRRVMKPEDSYSKYPKYESKKKVFRDVIRSIYQMKRLIENNKLQSLEKIKFSFKVGKNKHLSIHELVMLGNKIKTIPHYEHRFCIFKVDRILQRGGVVFYNGYVMNECQVVATLKYPYSVTKLKKLEKEYVIAYGLIKRAKDNPLKVFLELAHDFHIQSIEDSSVDQLFNNSVVESYLHKVQAKNEVQAVRNEGLSKFQGLDMQQNLMSSPNQLPVTSSEVTERAIFQPTKDPISPAPGYTVSVPSSNAIPLASHVKKMVKKKGAIQRFFEKLLGSN